MKQRTFYLSLTFLASFVLWTFLITKVDVAPIGPLDSAVGFATVNRLFHRFTGVHMELYLLTDWLSLIPLGVVPGFAILGLIQWIRRKQLRLVDRNILTLGGFYAIVLAVYVLFEVLVINYRPVLIDGQLEASYPSSTTVLVLCVMVTCRMQLKHYIHRPALRCTLSCAILLFTALMVLGRLLSGVHWITDIIGGIFLSCGLILLYDAANP